jgi:hypothetical protein
MSALLAIIAVELAVIVWLVAQLVRTVRRADRGGSLAIVTDDDTPIRTTAERSDG